MHTTKTMQNFDLSLFTLECLQISQVSDLLKDKSIESGTPSITSGIRLVMSENSMNSSNSYERNSSCSEKLQVQVKTWCHLLPHNLINNTMIKVKHKG